MKKLFLFIFVFGVVVFFWYRHEFNHTEINVIELDSQTQKNNPDDGEILQEKTIPSGKITIFNFLKNKEVKITLDDVEVVTIPYQDKIKNVAVVNFGESFVVVRFEIDDESGEVFIGVDDLVVERIDRGRFVVSDDEKFVVGFGEFPISAGLALYRAISTLPTKIITKNSVENVKIKNGVLRYSELVDERWEVQIVNLRAFTEL